MFNPNVVVKNIVTQSGVENTVTLIARILMAYIFLIAGWGKLTAYGATAGYMESMGVPAALLPITILVEFGGTQIYKKILINLRLVVQESSQHG